jgi:hypothetical protein
MSRSVILADEDPELQQSRVAYEEWKGSGGLEGRDPIPTAAFTFAASQYVQLFKDNQTGEIQFGKRRWSFDIAFEHTVQGTKLHKLHDSSTPNYDEASDYSHAAPDDPYFRRGDN